MIQSPLLPHANAPPRSPAPRATFAQETFVGFVELRVDGARHVLKLSGSESLTECSRELCGAQDCCGDKAYVVTVQNAVGRSDGACKRKRRQVYSAHAASHASRVKQNPLPPTPTATPSHPLPTPATATPPVRSFHSPPSRHSRPPLPAPYRLGRLDAMRWTERLHPAGDT